MISRFRSCTVVFQELIQFPIAYNKKIRKEQNHRNFLLQNLFPYKCQCNNYNKTLNRKNNTTNQKNCVRPIKNTHNTYNMSRKPEKEHMYY